MMPTPTHHRPRTARYYSKTLCSIADDFSSIFEGRGCRVLGRHGCKLMAVPRGFSRGFPAAETGRPLLLSSRPLNQTYGASPNGQHAALHNAERETRCAGSLTALELVHAERRWRMHGESKTTPAEAAPSLLLGRKASFLRLVRGRLAANSADPCSATLSCLFSTPRTRP